MNEPAARRRKLFRREYVDNLLSNPETTLTPKGYSMAVAVKAWSVCLARPVVNETTPRNASCASGRRFSAQWLTPSGHIARPPPRREHRSDQTPHTSTRWSHDRNLSGAADLNRLCGVVALAVRRACPYDERFVKGDFSGVVARRQLYCLPSPVGRSSCCHRSDALARTRKPKGSSPDERQLVNGGLEYSSWTAFGMVARQQISVHGGRGWRECKLQNRARVGGHRRETGGDSPAARPAG